MNEVWPEYHLAELTTKVGSGSTPRGGSEAYKSAGVPLIRSMNVVFFGFKRKGLVYLDDQQAAQLAAVTVQAGDVLLNITGASIGRVSIAPPDLAGARVNQHVCIIRPNEAIEPRFLAAYLSAPIIQNQIASDNFGVTRQALTKQQVLDLTVPVPPIAEQTRIADQLDILLAHVKACNDHLNAIPGLLKRFRKSVLDAATTGALTEDWREPDALPWRSVLLGDVASDFSYGSAAKSSKSGSVPVLRMGNIQQGELDWTDLVYTSDAKEIGKYELLPGDVLFNRTNSPELVGKTAVYQGEKAAIYAGYLIRVRCSEDLVPEFLNYCLGSKAGRNYCWSVKSDGVSQSNINAKKLAAFSFALPLPSEQKEIVRRAKDLFELIRRIEAQYKQTLTHSQRLAPQVLAKAFRGDLVPQDPNDEPAAALPARVTAERTTASKSRKTRAPRAARSSDSTSSFSKAMPTKSRQDEDVKGQPYLAGHLHRLGQPVNAQTLYEASELPVADFYKQLAWEIAEGHVNDVDPLLEPVRHAA